MASVMLPLDQGEATFLARDAEPLNFDLLFRNYGGALRSFCLARLGNAADADDACQEAMLKAYRARHGFRKGAAIWPWLATIAANVCIDMQRTSGRTTTMDDLGDCEAPGPEHAVDQRLRTEIVETAVRSLPDRYRAHVYWRDYEGWSYEEMARIEGTSVASVRTTLMRARRALRDRVEAVASSRRAWPLPAIVPLSARVRGFFGRGRDAARGMWLRARYAPPDLPSFGNAVAAAVLTVGIVASGAGSASAEPSPPAAPHTLAVSSESVSAPVPAAVPAPAPVATPRAGHTTATRSQPAPVVATPTTAPGLAPVAVAPPPAPVNPGIRVGPVGVGCPSQARGSVLQVICGTVSNP